MLNRNINYLLILLLTIAAGACSKQKTPEEGPATVMLFNALEDGVNIRANLSGQHPIQYITALLLSPRNHARVHSKQTTQPIAFYAAADTMPKDEPVWRGDLSLQRGNIYSLFLYSGAQQAETLLIEEKLPGFSKDSITYVRFANMSNGQPVSVNIQGRPHGSLISQLDFKTVSAFIPIPADKSVADYVFEVRDAATEELLAAFTAYGIGDYSGINNYLHRPWTLVLTGKRGGTGENLPQLNFFPNN
jgi:hypothetical protein